MIITAVIFRSRIISFYYAKYDSSAAVSFVLLHRSGLERESSLVNDHLPLFFKQYLAANTSLL